MGTLSPSDVRSICAGNLVDVLLPVEEFLKKHGHGEMRRPVTVTPDRTLSVAMAKVSLIGVVCVWRCGRVRLFLFGPDFLRVVMCVSVFCACMSVYV